jgi:hypothetical protein
LVTPALGTPSALVGTNITGTATAFNINGTVGATTPTAGSFTTLSASSSVSAPNTFGFKNRIINGAMMIDQRNDGASVTLTASNVYNLDRWFARAATGSGTTAIQSTTVPSNYKNSLLITVGTGASPGTTDNNYIAQRIEGLNMSDFGWGTATASTITISFWVRCSLTGTFGGAIQNSAFDRAYPFTYTISAANTWEQKSITIAGETSGTWLTTTGSGMTMTFDLGTGATYQGTAGAWASADYRAATGAVKTIATSGATFYITGVQLEKGSVATSFDYRDYGRELLMCQRYYWKILQGTGQGGGYGIVGSGVTGNGVWQTYGLPVFMRATPTVTVYGTWAVSNTGQPTAVSASASNFTLQTVATATAAIGVYPNSSDDLIDASAEL